MSFKEEKKFFTRVILTGQHKEMVYQVMNLFEIKEDKDLDIMEKNQKLTQITCKVLEGLQEDFEEYPPDLVLVQGDTSTAFAAALAAFYNKIPIGHIEAGLRTDTPFDPYPEEANRRLISQLSSIHFSPTERSKNNLKLSGITNNVYLTGNTVIDSLLIISNKVSEFSINGVDLKEKKLILATVHRRENWGENLNQIAIALKDIVNANQDTFLLFPMHRNPIIRKCLYEILGSHPRIKLSEPLDYDQLVSAIKKSTLVLTDSGGLQEEAPAFGKPVLVLRKTTERQEAIDSGTSKLVGTSQESVFAATNLLLNNDSAYSSMAKLANPFGDGKSRYRILKICCEFLGL